MAKKEYVCVQCNNIKLKYPSTVCGVNFFCSQQCKSLFQMGKFTGENNPNFGKKWSDDKKLKQSDLVKSKITDEIRYKSGSANRGKTLSDEQKIKISNATKGKAKGPHKKESIILIGIASAKKWTSEYKVRHRLKMESIGKWLPLNQKDDYEIYFQESNWIAFMFNIVDSDLLKNYGVWHYNNNKAGLVRDHKYSRKTGFVNKVFPEILRHPANCGLISHSENVRIAQAGIDDVITLEQLFIAIQNYKENWIEQKICLELITYYLSGKIWVNKHKKGAELE